MVLRSTLFDKPYDKAINCESLRTGGLGVANTLYTRFDTKIYVW